MNNSLSSISGAQRGVWSRSMRWLVRFRGWWRDHVSIEGRIDKDWRDFGGMSDDELEREYDKLLTGGGKPQDRFRRLCQYLSLRWLRDRNRTNGDMSGGDRERA